jgi:hypothetical protein
LTHLARGLLLEQHPRSTRLLLQQQGLIRYNGSVSFEADVRLVRRMQNAERNPQRRNERRAAFLTECAACAACG